MLWAKIDFFVGKTTTPSPFPYPWALMILISSLVGFDDINFRIHRLLSTSISVSADFDDINFRTRRLC